MSQRKPHGGLRCSDMSSITRTGKCRKTAFNCWQNIRRTSSLTIMINKNKRVDSYAVPIPQGYIISRPTDTEQAVYLLVHYLDTLVSFCPVDTIFGFLVYALYLGAIFVETQAPMHFAYFLLRNSNCHVVFLRPLTYNPL